MTETKRSAGRNLIPNSPELDDVESAAIKAVRAYEKAEKALAVFESEHADVFGPYSELLARLEEKRKVADAAMRSTDCSFGAWQRTEQRTYDVAALCDLIGETKFIELGGTVTKVPVYELEKSVLEVAIAARKIPATVVEQIRTITPKYRAPKARAHA